MNNEQITRLNEIAKRTAENPSLVPFSDTKNVLRMTYKIYRISLFCTLIEFREAAEYLISFVGSKQSFFCPVEKQEIAPNNTNEDNALIAIDLCLEVLDALKKGISIHAKASRLLLFLDDWAQQAIGFELINYVIENGN